MTVKLVIVCIQQYLLTFDSKYFWHLLDLGMNPIQFQEARLRVFGESLLKFKSPNGENMTRKNLSPWSQCCHSNTHAMRKYEPLQTKLELHPFWVGWEGAAEWWHDSLDFLVSPSMWPRSVRNDLRSTVQCQLRRTQHSLQQSLGALSYCELNRKKKKGKKNYKGALSHCFFKHSSTTQHNTLQKRGGACEQDYTGLVLLLGHTSSAD